MPQISLNNIEFRYNDKSILNNVNLEIEDGKFTVFLGPSGCGKSTLLNLISGLISPLKGQIFINNKDVSKMHPGERSIGYVFQKFALYPNMSVYENIEFPLKYGKGLNLKRDIIKQKVLDVAALLNISEILKSKSSDLSGGQQQRTAIGRAIVKEPSILLFDEPLSNLDKQLKHNLRNEIKLLHKRLKNTIVYVTHDQEEAFFLADKVILMNEGSIQQEAKPQELYLNPESLFAARFTTNFPNIFNTNELPLDFIIEHNFQNISRDNKIFFRPEDVDLIIQSEFSENYFIINEIIDFGTHKLVTIGNSNLEIKAINHSEDINIGQYCTIKLNKIITFNNV